MPDMTLTSLTAAVAPRSGKIIKNGLQNGMLHFAFKSSQSSEIVLQS